MMKAIAQTRMAGPPARRRSVGDHVLDVGVCPRNRTEVATLPVRIDGPDQLHVLLRHRLLRQPHGFESFGPIEEGLLQNRPRLLIERPHEGELLLEPDAAPLAAKADVREGHDLTVAQVDYFSRFEAEASAPRGKPVTVELKVTLVATIDRLYVAERPERRRGVNLDGRVVLRQHGLEVASVDRNERLTDGTRDQCLPETRCHRQAE